MHVKHYRELIVWQRAMQLVKEIYTLTKKLLPQEELYGLSSQMRRAAVSIPSNIAEGQARNGTKEFAQFLGISSETKAELQTQLLICIEIGCFQKSDNKNAIYLSEELGKVLSALIDFPDNSERGNKREIFL